MNPSEWNSVVSKIQENMKEEKATVQKGSFDSVAQNEDPDEKFSDKIKFDDEVRYNTWQVKAPMEGITRHPNYKDINEMIVVCGQKTSLIDLIQYNLKEFIKTDLIYFQLILLLFNMCIFVGFTWFFERRLQTKVTKPIQDLTK